MAKSNNLRVWHQARELLRNISAITADMRAEGDLKSQLRRAAISVVSNISSLRPVGQVAWWLVACAVCAFAAHGGTI